MNINRTVTVTFSDGEILAVLGNQEGVDGAAVELLVEHQGAVDESFHDHLVRHQVGIVLRGRNRCALGNRDPVESSGTSFRVATSTAAPASLRSSLPNAG
jgi:hypothetical protein